MNISRFKLAWKALTGLLNPSCIKILVKDTFKRCCSPKALLVSAAFLASGCVNLLYRTDTEVDNKGPYYCTCEVAGTVAAAFSEPKGPEGQIAKAVATIILPVSLIDLPLEAVVDTLYLPWDLVAAPCEECTPCAPGGAESTVTVDGETLCL